MRKFGWMIAAAVGALALAAAPAEAQTKLRFFTNFDANAVRTWQPILDAYEKANPNVKVTMETVAGSGAAIYPDVLRTSMAAGDPPDVFFMWGGEIAGPFIDAGQVMDLGAMYEKHGWKQRMTPWTVDAITRNGKVWGVPFNARGMGFFYRKDIFAKHKLSPRATPSSSRCARR
jgi:raffinose/stachyose/melibiose transport system substrate-binding protein